MGFILAGLALFAALRFDGNGFVAWLLGMGIYGLFSLVTDAAALIVGLRFDPDAADERAVVCPHCRHLDPFGTEACGHCGAPISYGNPLWVEALCAGTAMALCWSAVGVWFWVLLLLSWPLLSTVLCLVFFRHRASYGPPARS